MTPEFTQPTALGGGFATPATEAARAFRGVMNAMACPGVISQLEGATPPAPLSAAAGAVLLTLCDGDTPLYLAGAADCAEIRDWIAFHTGAPLCGSGDCAFALGAWAALMPVSTYPVGVADYPDRSATLIVEMPGLTASGARLRGPGIRDSAALSLPETEAFQKNHALFPLGLDFLFTCGDHLAALPRSTEVL